MGASRQRPRGRGWRVGGRGRRAEAGGQRPAGKGQRAEASGQANSQWAKTNSQWALGNRQRPAGRQWTGPSRQGPSGISVPEASGQQQQVQGSRWSVSWKAEARPEANGHVARGRSLQAGARQRPTGKAHGA